MRRHRAWMLSVGVLLVAVPLGLGDKPAPAVNPGPVAEGPKPSPTKPEVGRNEAVAAIRGLGGAVLYDEKSPERPIVLVDLVETDVVDADLVFLKGMTHLRTLYLNGTRATDAGLQHLKGLTSLETLRLGASVGDFGGRYRGLCRSPMLAWSI